MRPADPTAAGALGETCDSASATGEPLVVDWPSNRRADLEEAMHDGVAVVAYDCKSLTLLRQCSIDATYGFMGFSKKDDVIRLQDSQEIALNLPSFGVSLIKEIDADLQQGSSLDLATVLVGKRRTTLSRVDADALVGGEACKGATHFVRGAYVGAFAMETSSKGSASVSVSSIFSASASTSSSKLASHRDGELQACVQADPLADAPSPACAAQVRLELWPIAAAASALSATAGDAPVSCPHGATFSNGKCTHAPATLDPCFTLARDGCDEECGKGNLDACERAADAVFDKYVQTHQGMPDELAYAAGLYDKTCAAGNPIGCNQRGYMHSHGVGGPKNDAAAAGLYQRSCLEGNEQACNNLAMFYEDGRGVKGDAVQAIALYKRACNGGRAVACGNLGVMYKRGHGVPADNLAASVFFKRACDGLDGASCWRLAVLLLASDPPSAARAAKRGASTGEPNSSVLYGEMIEEGKAGLTQDPKAAAALYEVGCGQDAPVVDETDPEGCTRLGYLYGHGMGVAEDLARAAALYKLGCDRGDGGGCNELGLLALAGSGMPKDVARSAQLFARACKLEDSGGCGNLGQAKERGAGVARDLAGAITLYRTACKAGDSWSCDQLKRLKAAP